MGKLLIATRNQGKVMEFSQLFHNIPYELVSLDDEGITIDVNNVIEVYQEISNVAKNMRKGNGPIIIEAMTFRMRGHEEASGTDYIPKELFNEFLEAVNAYDQRKFLLDNVNYFDPKTNALEFNLNIFSKFLKARDYKISRPALCTKIKRVLKAEKKKGSAISHNKEKVSVVTWRIEEYHLKPNQRTIEGEIADDVKRIKLDE